MGLHLPRAVTVLGTVALALGVLALAVVVLAQPFGGCTEVRVDPGQATSPDLRGVEDGSVVYSPDGVNECSTPLSTVALPLASVLGGAGLVWYGRLSG